MDKFLCWCAKSCQWSEVKKGLLSIPFFFRVRYGTIFISLIVLTAMVVMLLSPMSYAQNQGKPGIYLQERAPNQATELRGVWLTNIDSDVLFGRRRLENALQRLKELNFNTVYPAIWNWGWTLYPSPVAGKVIGKQLDPEPGLRGRDILKEMTIQGHKKGLTVIPWFEFGFMAPADSELAKRQPQWLTSRRDGSQVWKEGKHNRVWLNPFHPEVQSFIKSLILEIVKNYDVDGIQFDDHFGLPSELGYDKFTVKLYQKEHNGQLPPKDPKNPEWVKWRADKITAYLQEVFREIKNIKEDCLVSIAPNPQRFSYEYFLADWQQWERMGLVEELILQIYRNDINVFISELERPEVKAAQSHIPVSIGILSGLKDRTVPLKQIETQVQVVRDRGFAGVSFFFYETLWKLAKEKPVERQLAFRKMFPTPMAPPNILLNKK
jgi:uncharacterized lipoprotein YddW (UPF0748 family)